MSKVDQSKGSATKEMVRGSIWQAQMFHMGLCSQLILATGIVYLLQRTDRAGYLESMRLPRGAGVRGGAGAGHFHRAGLGKVRTFRHGAARDDLRRGRLHRGVRHRRAAGALGRAEGAEHLPRGQRPGRSEDRPARTGEPPCGLRQVTQNSNVDSLALQLALVLGAWMLAYYAVEAVATRVPSSIGGTMWGLFFLINMVSAS